MWAGWGPDLCVWASVGEEHVAGPSRGAGTRVWGMREVRPCSAWGPCGNFRGCAEIQCFLGRLPRLVWRWAGTEGELGPACER